MTEIVEIASRETVVIEHPAGSELIVVESSPVLEVVEAAEQGPAGPRGLPGEKGERGDPGLAGASLVHEQATPAADWGITHNLNRYPSVTVIDSAGGEVEGDIAYIDSNRIQLSFSAPFAGKAFIN